MSLEKINDKCNYLQRVESLMSPSPLLGIVRHLLFGLSLDSSVDLTGQMQQACISSKRFKLKLLLGLLVVCEQLLVIILISVRVIATFIFGNHLFGSIVHLNLHIALFFVIINIKL